MSIRILGLNGSIRRLGNTEILLKTALHSVYEQGAEVDLACLHDFKIESCRGCLRCLLNGEECPVHDDLKALFDLWSSYDAVLVGAPNYINGLPAVFKQLSDRSFYAFAHYPELFSATKASVFLTYMYEDFPYNLPLSKLAFIFHGFRFDFVEGQALATNGVPGSVLQHPDSLTAACRMGSTLLEAVRTGTKPRQEYINRCPDCLCDFFIYHDDGRVQCPVCYRLGRMEEGKAVFRDEYTDVSIVSDRWRQFEREQISNRASEDNIRAVSKPRRSYKDRKYSHIRRIGPRENMSSETLE